MQAPSMSADRWERLGRINPEAIRDTRIQLHWATAIVSAVGNTLLDPEEDGGQESLDFHPRSHTLVGRSPPSAGGFAPALRLEDATLVLRDPNGVTVDVFPLHGRTMGQAMDWLAAAYAAGTDRPLRCPLAPPSHVLPAHAVGSGQQFFFHSADPFRELARWFSNAQAVLEQIAKAHEHATPVRCWPAGFDLATCLRFERGGVIVGMSPGDDRCPEPYWYATPLPRPAVTDLEHLPHHGQWLHNGWLGAILPASELIAGDADQAEQVRGFLRGAVTACRALLRPPRHQHRVA